jgi:hypothetical protein
MDPKPPHSFVTLPQVDPGYISPNAPSASCAPLIRVLQEKAIQKQH